jgi:hypothetical protein
MSVLAGIREKVLKWSGKGIELGTKTWLFVRIIFLTLYIIIRLVLFF